MHLLAGQPSSAGTTTRARSLAGAGSLKAGPTTSRVNKASPATFSARTTDPEFSTGAVADWGSRTFSASHRHIC